MPARPCHGHDSRPPGVTSQAGNRPASRPLGLRSPDRRGQFTPRNREIPLVRTGRGSRRRDTDFSHCLMQPLPGSAIAWFSYCPMQPLAGAARPANPDRRGSRPPSPGAMPGHAAGGPGARHARTVCRWWAVPGLEATETDATRTVGPKDAAALAVLSCCHCLWLAMSHSCGSARKRCSPSPDVRDVVFTVTARLSQMPAAESSASSQIREPPHRPLCPQGVGSGPHLWRSTRSSPER